MKRRIFRTGHSLAITIPRQAAKAWDLQAGEEVEVRIEYRRQRLIVTFLTPRQISLLAWKPK